MAYDGKLLARARLRLQDIKSENQAEQYRSRPRCTPAYRRYSGWTAKCVSR